MKVALLGMKGDFLPDTGSGIKRYTFELYTNLIKISKNIEKVEFKPIKFTGIRVSFCDKNIFC